ncbi:WD40-repeat-containing domain protein [Pilobolus umbonatus]|nr:WD40-repeat-containing domain protein [Pilobolus umbonatus]
MHWFHGGDRCITTSLDKRIIRWNVKSREPFQILNTQNAFPYCLDSPVWNIGEIGVAMGDGCIKQWNYSNVNSIMRSNKPHNYYDSNVFWKGLSGHIKNIQYHPTRENILAYTTSNGNIGIYDTVKNQCTQFKYYYSNSESVGIYWALDMSSVLGNPHMTDALISCNSEGEIIALDSNKHTSQAIVINSVLERLNPGWINSIKEKVGFMRTCMAIDENRKYIAFGHKDGLVEVYMLDTLKIVFASNYHIRNITSMDWKILGNNIWLATGSGDGKIGIHQLTITIESYSEDKHQIVPSSHIFRTLMKDNSPVSTVKWSHDPDKAIIAAGSFSSFVTVWDISDKKRVSVFTQHRDRVISVCWSRLELDNLFTGSEDRFIYEFDYKDYLCTEPLNSKSICILIVDAVTSSSRIQLEAHALSIAGKALEKNVNHSIKYLLDRLTREEQCDPMVEEYSSTFMTKEERSEDKKGEVIHMMFGDKNDIHQLLAIEAHAMDQRKVEESTVVHSVKNNLLADYDMKLAMDIMQGHYQTMGDGPGMDTPVNISDWIMLALSPMVGKETWIKAMKNQADRLRKNGHYHLAASCYIACSHIYDAVAVYRDHSMFREAIVLAKLRLPVDDPILIPLYREWASDLQSKNEDELAAIW